MIRPYGIQHFHSLSRREQVNLLSDMVYIEEKFDGYSCYFKLDENGELEVATKGRQNVHLDPRNFTSIMPILQDRVSWMVPGLEYYCELVNQHKMVDHEYETLPHCGLILWDVWDEKEQEWLVGADKIIEANNLGIDCSAYASVEVLPEAFEDADNWGILTTLAHGPSILGGKREGVIIKNYERTRKGFPLVAKVVAT